MSGRPRSRAVRFALLVLIPALGLGRPASGCSMCRCGDPTFAALGTGGFSATGLRLALDWERFDKDEGDPSDESESQVEDRFTALVAYGFSERFSVVARVPWSRRELSENVPGEEPERIRTSGVSDPEIHAQVRLWASPLRAGLGRRASLSLLAGIKPPWGENDLRRDGERVDEHAQPGTGSTDLFAGVAWLYLLDERSALFVSAGYRKMGENGFGYRYGDVALASLSYERKLASRLDAVASLDYRHAGEDRTGPGGELDDDTGGTLLYFSPRLLVDLGSGVVLRAGAQIPVVRDLHGFQKERAVANVGVTYLFGR